MKAILSLSGGMDSATVLAEAKDQGREIVAAVSFFYGSKHNSYERDAAFALAQHYAVHFVPISLTEAMSCFKSDLLKTGGNIPEGHYEAETMRATVVPARNMIFAAILAGLAESLSANEVWLGVHAGDHHIYPDCRPDFLVAMGSAMSLATDGKVHLVAPYVRHHKQSILRRGLGLGVPYALTRTCYKDQEVACGKCGSCQERLEAFAALSIADPVEYESRELLPK